MATKYPIRQEIGELCPNCKRRDSVVVIVEAKGESGYWKCESEGCGWDDKDWSNDFASVSTTAIKSGLARK